MFDKILLPIDLNHTESWEKALPMAKRCAGETGELHLLAIVHDIGAAMVASYLPAGFEKKAMEDAKAELAEFAEANAKGATVHVGHGHVPQTILHAADDIGADLIVMASHPPSELRSLLIGSNADRIVHNAKIPVLVVR